MDCLLLVDGSNLLFQMFYGMPARISGKNGQPIHGVLGFVGALLKMIRTLHPTHVAVIFDGECENDRTQIDPAYKSDRPDFSAVSQDETPFGQLPGIFRCLQILKIPYFETTNCEADDIFSAYAKYCPENREIILVSQDSDLFQLITDRILVYRYRGEKSVFCDAAYLWDRYGVLPAQYAAFKSLTGDGSDHISGVPGIGPKRAAYLMNCFSDLDDLFAHLDSVAYPTMRNALRENMQRVRTNYRLIALDDHAGVPFSWDQMVFHDQNMTTFELLQLAQLR